MILETSLNVYHERNRVYLIQVISNTRSCLGTTDQTILQIRARTDAGYGENSSIITVELLVGKQVHIKWQVLPVQKGWMWWKSPKLICMQFTMIHVPCIHHLPRPQCVRCQEWQC